MFSESHSIPEFQDYDGSAVLISHRFRQQRIRFAFLGGHHIKGWFDVGETVPNTRSQLQPSEADDQKVHYVQ
jgi:hypothetical protein